MLNDINKIIFNFEDGNILDIPGKYVSKMYISNIDKVGDEIPYEETILKNKLYANFVLFKFNKVRLDLKLKNPTVRRCS